jgi:hypothetical protein
LRSALPLLVTEGNRMRIRLACPQRRPGCYLLK